MGAIYTSGSGPVELLTSGIHGPMYTPMLGFPVAVNWENYSSTGVLKLRGTTKVLSDEAGFWNAALATNCMIGDVESFIAIPDVSNPASSGYTEVQIGSGSATINQFPGQEITASFVLVVKKTN